MSDQRELFAYREPTANSLDMIYDLQDEYVVWLSSFEPSRRPHMTVLYPSRDNQLTLQEVREDFIERGPASAKDRYSMEICGVESSYTRKAGRLAVSLSMNKEDGAFGDESDTFQKLVADRGGRVPLKPPHVTVGWIHKSEAAKVKIPRAVALRGYSLSFGPLEYHARRPR